MFAWTFGIVRQIGPVAPLLLALLSGCLGGSGGGSGSGGDGSLSSPCADDGDCDDDLFCARGGALSGQCTMFCDTSSACVIRFGDETTCNRDDVCARSCTSGRTDRCPAPLVCSAVYQGDDGYCQVDRSGQPGDAWLLRCSNAGGGFNAGAGGSGSSDGCSFICAVSEADALEQLRARNNSDGPFGPEDCEFVDPSGPQTTCTVGDYSDDNPLALCSAYVF